MPRFSCFVSYYQFVITYWYFSRLFKLAKVTTIPKASDSTNSLNYSQFAVFSKIFENVENEQFYTYFDKIIYFMSLNTVSENITPPIEN